MDTSVLSQIGRLSAQEQVVLRLRDAICMGVLQPGERLQQEELANRLGVSRMPIREALKRLEAEGLVTNHPYRGAMVALLSLTELQEIYELRITLEALAVGVGIPNMNSSAINTLRQILQRMDRESDPHAWLVLNSKFHTSLYQSSERPLLLEMIDNLRYKSDRYLRMFAAERERTEHAQKEHWAILAACEEKAVELAKDLLRHHLGSTVDLLTAALSAAQKNNVSEGKGG